jgi:hypothetical protein
MKQTIQRIIYDCRACDKKDCKSRQQVGLSENCPLKQCEK